MPEYKTLTIDLKIPLQVENLIGASALTFDQWLPLGKDKGIKLSECGIDLNFWFDIETTHWGSSLTEEEIKNRKNVMAHYILCEVKVTDVDSKLAVYLQDKKRNVIDEDEKDFLKKEYEKLGEKILHTVLTRLNRLISYTRNFKGQYWLLEYPIDMGRMSSMYTQFEAVGRIDGGGKFSFHPNGIHCITVLVTSDESYIREDEWDEVIKFVGSDRSPPLALELLAGAEQLEGNGYDRGALTEAVTALEVALSNFSERQKNNDELSLIMGSRMNVPNIKNQIKHMGLSGSVNYLLPLILPNDVLPEKVLKGCQDALEKRQNVVHNGSRNAGNVAHYISCIRECSQILMNFPERIEGASAVNTDL